MIGHAVVLKNYFIKKNKVTILHEQFGKISFFIHEKEQAARLCNGSLIYCHVIKKKSLYQCEFVDAYFIPFYNDAYDVYFVHDILKICLEFLPDHLMVTDVFDLILDIYNNIDHVKSCQKKIYLLKLFLYIGIFPENQKLYHHVMQDVQLHNHDSDELLQQGLRYCWNSDVITFDR